MKRISLIFVLAVYFIVISGAGILYAYTELKTVTAIRGEGEVPLNVQAILDNFNTQAATNAWNCLTGTFSKSTVIPTPANEKCTASYINDANAYSGYSLKLDYNVSALNTFAGYYSQLGAGNLSIALPPNTAASNAISFYVKGKDGGEFFKVQLKNNSTTLRTYGVTTQYYRNTASVYITDYLDGGVTTAWQKVTIPFDNFMNLDGWTSMKEFVVVFENSQCVANGSPTSGTVYIDNIAFETTPASVARIDHFGHKGKDVSANDVPGANALGGNIGSGGDGGTVNAFADAVSYSPYKYSLRLEYNVNSGYAYTFLIFGGGQDIDPNPVTNKSGWIPIPHNFNGYNYLYFRIRAKSDTENPKIVKIELKDEAGSGTKIVYVGPIHTTWEDVWIILDQSADSPVDPASDIHNLDRSTLKQLTFTFENGAISWWNTQNPSDKGNMAGTIYIDSLEFQKW
jgi:hypothetical protein